MALKNQHKKTDLGLIKLHLGVISSIANLAAQEVDGVNGLRSGIFANMLELFGKKDYASGVKVELGEADAKVTLFVIADYGVNIPEVAGAVQENVKQALERMAGLSNAEVNVEIVGIAPRKGKGSE